MVIRIMLVYLYVQQVTEQYLMIIGCNPGTARVFRGCLASRASTLRLGNSDYVLG